MYTWVQMFRTDNERLSVTGIPETAVTHGRPQRSGVPSSPLATLVAMTNEATLALGGQREVGVTSFPFNVGRESRVSPPADPVLIELRLGAAPELNDLYLLEPSWQDLLNISREHFAVEHADHQFFLIDRCSACGTIVAGTQVGGDRTGGRTELRSGDEIIVGTDTSPYVFRFDVSEHVP